MLELILEEWRVIYALMMFLGLIITYFQYLFPVLASMLLRSHQQYHLFNVFSDIPGNIHVFDYSIISLFRTLPEPSNFNVVWTAVPLDEAVLIRGQLPTCRLSSISIYDSEKLTSGKASVPISKDINEISQYGKFQIVIQRNSDHVGDANLPTLVGEGFNYCMISMRNYLASPGQRFITPVILRLRDGKVLREAQPLITGTAGLMTDWSHSSRNLLKIFQLSVLTTLMNTFVLSSKNAIFVSTFSILIPFSLRWLFFRFGKKSLRVMVRRITEGAINRFFLPSLETSAGASQPSSLHIYWIMEYDLTREDSELSITGKIKSANQKYWSLVVYDLHGICLSQYIFDENVHRIESSSTISTDIEYRYDIRLHSGSVGVEDSSCTYMNVSTSPRGYALLRIVHPAYESVAEYSSPQVVPVIIQGKYKNN